jgi:hypothetical protein
MAFQEHDTRGHRIHIDFLGEEHLSLPMKCDTLISLAPKIVTCAPPSFFEDLFTLTTDDLLLSKRMMRRTMGLFPAADAQYVGKPLWWTRDIDTIRKVFPGVRVIRCVRDFEDAWVSLMTLERHAVFAAQSIAVWKTGANVLYKYLHVPNYLGVCRMVPDHTMLFADWCKDSEMALKQIGDLFKLKRRDPIGPISIYREEKQEQLSQELQQYLRDMAQADPPPKIALRYK